MATAKMLDQPAEDLQHRVEDAISDMVDRSSRATNEVLDAEGSLASLWLELTHAQVTHNFEAMQELMVAVTGVPRGKSSKRSFMPALPGWARRCRASRLHWQRGDLDAGTEQRGDDAGHLSGASDNHTLGGLPAAIPCLVGP